MSAFRQWRRKRHETVRSSPEGQSPGGEWKSRPALVIGAWAFADQALMSGSNFATTLLVGRAVAPAQFGRFVLAYTCLWFFQGIQRALIVEPMNVLAARKDGADYRRYVASAAAMQVAFAIVAGLLVLMVAGVVASERNLLLAFAAALVAWQCQEFVRRIFYNRAQGGSAFINDALSYGGQIAFLIVLYERGDLTPVSALLSVAATSALGTVFGLWQARSHLVAAVSLSSVKEVAVANWQLGGWLLGTSSIQEAAGRLYIFLLTAIIAPAGLAALTAAVTLCRLPDIAWRALDTMLPAPASRRLKESSKAGLDAYLGRVALIGIPAVVGVMAVLIIFAGDILHLVYGGKYDGFATTMRIASVASLAYFLAMLLRVAFKSLEETRPLFIASSASALFSMTAGLALAAAFGVNGAAWEVALGPAIALAVLVFSYWLVSRRPDSAQTARRPQGALRQWLRPTGLTVAVLGPDGAGKSTVIGEGQAALLQNRSNTETIHFPPRLPWSGGRAAVTDPHGKAPRPALVSSLKVIYWVAALNVDYLVRVRPRLVRGSVVFLDRCLFDVLVDPRRYRYGGPRWLIRFALRVTPRPDLVILLDAPADALRERKQEVSPAEADRQIAAYRELIRGLPNGRIVDAGQPLPRVVADVSGAIFHARDESGPDVPALELVHEQRQAGS